MDLTYTGDNDAERERMRRLLARLSDDELGRPLGDGRTAASILGHVAFWDQRVIELLTRWEGGARPSPDEAEPEAVDWLNDSVKRFQLALAPRALAELALEIAEEVDARAAALSPQMKQTVAAAQIITLNRAAHRREHLDELEAMFGS